MNRSMFNQFFPRFNEVADDVLLAMKKRVPQDIEDFLDDFGRVQRYAGYTEGQYKVRAQRVTVYKRGRKKVTRVTYIERQYKPVNV